VTNSDRQSAAASESLSHSLEEITVLAADVVDADCGVGLTIIRDREPITVAASAERAKQLDEIQYGEGHGPCVFERHELDDDERAAIEMFCADASRAVSLAVRYDGLNQQSQHLHKAMASRRVIDQAIGLVMAQNRCDADAAFNILRRAAPRRTGTSNAASLQTTLSTPSAAPSPTQIRTGDPKAVPLVIVASWGLEDANRPPPSRLALPPDQEASFEEFELAAAWTRDNLGPFVDTVGAAEILGVTPQYVGRLAAQGRLPWLPRDAREVSRHASTGGRR
jgi:hypothetical protein